MEKGKYVAKQKLKDVRWNFKDFGYDSYKDPKIEEDVVKIEKMLKDLTKYKGKVVDNLEAVIKAEIELEELSDKIYYLSLLSAQNIKDQNLLKILNDYSVRLDQLGAELEFISIEIGKIITKK